MKKKKVDIINGCFNNGMNMSVQISFILKWFCGDKHGNFN